MSLSFADEPISDPSVWNKLCHTPVDTNQDQGTFASWNENTGVRLQISADDLTETL
jgi:hypothetical protein